MSDIKGSAIRQRKIDVYGITGEFSVLKGDDEQPIKVRYFQTVASNRENDASGNALDLLSELKPMRERVKSEDLNDLRSLLQRDLSDFRVANDLVPYLQGKNSRVGFFPSILVALIPKDFLLQEADGHYPVSSKGEKTNQLNYENFWSVENYEIDGNVVSLARLSVNPNETDFIVLDGQHRANAFRYMAGTFDPATDESSIYSIFYQHCEEHDPSSFDAELPVTIVWFEGEKGVPPNLISRKLFVDVNTTAKKVSESRNILLNDTELAAVCTTSVYSRLAENGYALNSLSLMHGGFDCEGRFPSDFPAMTIFSPKTLHYMLSYFLLARPEHSALGNNISRDPYGNFYSYRERVKDLCPGLTDEIISDVISGNSQALDHIHELFSEHIVNNICKVLNKFEFFRVHFNACSELEDNLVKNGAAEKIGAWNKVFKGGEGLYNAFSEDALNQVEITGRLRTYKYAVDAINAEFASKRNEVSENYNAAFSTLTSQAGLTGLFMALEKCIEVEGWNEQTINDFISSINSYSVDDWVLILTSYKSIVLPQNSPKLWPKMREIFLRFIEFKGNKWEFFNNNNLQKFHPDFVYCKNLVSLDYKEYRRNNMDDPPGDDIKEKWIDTSFDNLNDCLLRIGVQPYNEGILKQKLNDWLSGEILTLYPPQQDSVEQDY